MSNKHLEAIALQNAFLRLIYSAFREQLWPSKYIQFRLSNTQGKRYFLSNEWNTLRFIYTKNPSELYLFEYSFNLEETFHQLTSVESFWHEVLLSALPIDMEFTKETLQKAFQKIKASIAADHLALQAKQQVMYRFEANATSNMWAWIVEVLDPLERSRFLMQFASLKGNPTHPLSKLKKGFNEVEQQNYAPEFAKPIAIMLVAVACGLCKVTKQRQSIFVIKWFKKAFPDAFAQWEEQLSKKGYALTHYLPIPVHPFQWPHIKDRFQSAIEQGFIIPLPEVSIYSQASTSLRTVMPLQEDVPYIKLPLNIQTTSLVRTHSPPRVHGGPILSRLVEDILASDQDIASLLKIINEPLGIYINDETYYQEKQNPSYHFNVLYKDNPSTLISKGEIYLPLSAAFESTPCSKQPLLLDIMEANGVQNKEAALSYFLDYAWKIIRSQVGLYAAYGIAVEGHQQNTGLVFDKNGALQYTLIGDLAGGLEIYEPILLMCGFNIKQDMHPTKKHLFEEGEVPEQQILHTTFNYHLWPFAIMLTDAFQLELHYLIRRMEEMVLKTISIYRSQPRHIVHTSNIPIYLQELDRIQNVLLKEDVQVRSLLRMSLADTQLNIYTAAPNPFRVFQAISYQA